MRHLARALAALSMILPALLGGCSDTQLVTIYEQPSIVGQPDALGPTEWADEFQQRTIAASDILFVVDDSCSMSEEQEALAANFDAFISNFVGTNLDYHIGVTRAALEASGGPLTPPSAEWGQLESASDGSRWLSSETADIITEFNEMANVGTNGHNCEMALQASFSALMDRAVSGGYNDGFYREDAHLTLVLLSDENDHGQDEAFPPLVPACGGIDPQEYSDWFMGLKGYNHQDRLSFTAIVGGWDGCNGEDADPAPAYMEVVEAVGGNFLSICAEDWSTFLTELGLEAAGLKKSFQLRRIPVEDTLVLTIDGEVPAEGVWSYDRQRNSIDFPIEHVPAELAIVRVEYELQEDTGVVVPPLDE